MTGPSPVCEMCENGFGTPPPGRRYCKECGEIAEALEDGASPADAMTKAGVKVVVAAS